MLAETLGKRQFLHRHLYELLYAAESVHLVRDDERECLAFALSAGCAAYAVHIVLRVAWDVKVNDDVDVRDVYSAGNDVCGHENLDLPVAELAQHLLALCLLKIRVDDTSREAFAFQRVPQLLDALFARAEDDDALPLVAVEYVHNQPAFLRLVDRVGRLAYARGWLGYGYRYFGRVAQDAFGKFADLWRHGGREHQCLAGLDGQEFDHLHDVVKESHVEHPVSLIKYKVAHLAEVDIAHRYVLKQSSRRCNDNVGTLCQGCALPAPLSAVAATIDGCG